MNSLICSTYNFDLSENVSYNIPSFPAYIRQGVLSLYPDFRANPHWHEDLEFIYILDGDMTYQVNGQIIELHPKNGIFINSRQLHYGFSEKRQECHFICILLHPSLLSANPYFEKQYVEPFIRNTNCPFYHLQHTLDWNQHLLNLLQRIWKENKKEMTLFSLQRHFFEIFELLYENIAIETATSFDTTETLNILKTMILYTHEHYKENLSLAEIAQSGSCCKSKCSALFKQYLNESPIVHLNKYRLEMSCQLLRNPNLPIIEVALDSGFHGASYYCEIFHKYYGLTPMAYRKKFIPDFT